MNNVPNISMPNRPPILPTPQAMLQINASQINSQQPNDLRKTYAYAKLEGPRLKHFIVTSSVVLGRNRMVQKGTNKRKLGEMQASNQDDSDTVSDSFVGLGWNTNISKRHIEIMFDFRKRSWVLLCYGKNGVWIDSTFVDQVPGAHFFYFLCPANATGRSSEKLVGIGSAWRWEGFGGGSALLQVLATSKDRRASMVEIVESIKKKFPFYGKQPDALLNNAVKQCLTNNKCFSMVVSDQHEDNHQAATWTVDALALAELLAEKAIEHPERTLAPAPPPAPTTFTPKTEATATVMLEGELGG
ncbi:hypothetical protein GUITHDRAFT_147385 [Guillardia theta CCMP2712]|uniref:FHA domain-containing protein n=1 Tax=Guillardia theta (strain CCMP2712) TaxID=905079 RepID=L1ID69_GUITC|nr:hypothetical protein GUITHDRAFT_147385 [Guillardia theta CCMP2712]EKX34201.1 hypothetical protein GUITHDRAFT_147385 [Guillardia theta CCMP2712]|eukprot:XP_005821181.1 hypothetical protein GUITHDRAFT_147385 [Guillardia theta CCMP2712]